MRSEVSRIVAVLPAIVLIAATGLSADVSSTRGAPGILYVDRNATDPNQDGMSWCTAFTDLQDALDVAVPGMTIRVADGVYTPDRGTGDRAATFDLPEAVRLQGGYAGCGAVDPDERRIGEFESVLSGDLLSNDGAGGSAIAENSYHVVTASGLSPAAALDGVTVAGGNADGSNPHNRGAGLLNVSGSPTLVDCTFRGNATGGLGLGAGMFNGSGCNPTLLRCTFVNNSAGFGGGLASRNGSNPTLMSCLFAGNLAGSGGGVASLNGSTPLLVNCVFTGNTAGFGGAIVNDSGGEVVLINCTVSGNSAAGGGGMASLSAASAPIVVNSIFWGNSNGAGMGETAQILDESNSASTVTYSIIQGGWSGAGGTGVISADPLLLDADGADNTFGTLDDDLRLSAGSAAIDAADNQSLPADLLDLDGDGDADELLSVDFSGNPRQLDDPFTPDNGASQTPVVDMGAHEFTPDCDENGILDFCELDCGAPGGICDVAGCGAGSDCNGNAILDGCDIAACVGDPGCGDCNFNNVPDACDITNLTAVDEDLDGVPDGCATFNGNCDPTLDWSCADNWDLAGVFPNNTESLTFAVTLDGVDNVFLDVSVVLDGLQLVNGAKLSVIQANELGDLSIVADSGLILEGELVVDNGRIIEVQPGSVLVGPGGLYHHDPSRGDPSEADETLVTGNLTLSAGVPCPPECPALPGGTFILEGTMSLTVTGDLILDGPPSDTGRSGAPRGGLTPPPEFGSFDGSSATLSGSLVQNGVVTLSCTSSDSLDVGGDYAHQGTAPGNFDWDTGALTMNGTGGQAFEVPGEDRGASAAGFETNFSIGTLEIATGSSVTFSDQFDNTGNGSDACAEAQYVHTLVLRSGASVHLDNCRLYYETLVAEGASIVSTGCGALVQIKCASDAECDDLDPCTVEACAPSDPGADAFGCNYLYREQLFGDIARIFSWQPGAPPQPDLDDILCSLDAFSVGALWDLVCPLADLWNTPDNACGTDGDLNLDDILKVLDAFVGILACPHACPP